MVVENTNKWHYHVANSVWTYGCEGHPAGPQPSINVILASIWRHDVASTLVRRYIDAICLLDTIKGKLACC